MTSYVLAIDGGNSKTDVALVTTAGESVAHVRGPGSSPHSLGVDGCAALLDSLVAKVAARAGLAGPRAVAAVASVYLAGADIPAETALLHSAISAYGWADELVVDNDTVALLRAGTDEPDAVAVVCGAGINCVGVTRDGRQARFPSLGRISGDWGGGVQLGDEALFWAARAADGRGEATVMQERVVTHFGRTRLSEVIEDIHFGRIPSARLGELSPMVLHAASVDNDAIATKIVVRLAREVVTYASTALRRLGLLDASAVVVLGGGVLTSGDPLLHRHISDGLAATDPSARIVITQAAPVVGAALLGLERLGAAPGAEERLRSDLVVTPT